MNIHKALQALYSRIGVNNIEKYDSVVTVTKNHIWTNLYDSKHIIALQKEYGTGKVDYCPSVYILGNSGSVKNDNSLLIVQGKNPLVIEGLENTLNPYFSSITTIDSNISYRTSLRTFTKASFVIINGVVRDSILYSLLSTTRPFILVNCNVESFNHLLYLSSTEDLSLCDPNIDQVLSKVKETLEEYDDISTHLEKFERRMRSYISWVTTLKAFCNNNFTDDNLPTESAMKFRFVVSPADSDDFTFGRILANSLYEKSVKGGIHFLQEVETQFTKSDIMLLHPWVGILEIGSTRLLDALFKNNRFIASLSFCEVLFVYSPDIKAILDTKFPEYNLKVVLIPLLSVKQRKQFDISAWKSEATFFNIEVPNTSVPLINGVTKSDFIKKDISCLSENINRVAVIHKDQDNNLHRLSLCISYGIPIVLKRTKISELILGKNYTLFTSNIVLNSVVDFLDEENVMAASEHIQHLIMTKDVLIDKLILKNPVIDEISEMLF